MELIRPVSLALSLTVLGCGDPPPPTPEPGCVDGMSVACSCADGRTGAQVCLPTRRFGPCLCASPDAATDALLVDATGDQGTDVLPPDVSFSDGPALDLPATDSGLIDVPPVDVPPVDVPRVDVPRVDVPPVDVPPVDVPPADVPLGCGGGACAVGEVSLPWTSAACTLWSQVPPAHAYLPPLVTAEGLWAASQEDLMVMLRGPSGWSMSRLGPPESFHYNAPPGVVALVPSPGTITAVGNADYTGNGFAFERRAGRWVDLSDATLRGLRLEAASASGSALFVVDNHGRLYVRDGGPWREITGLWIDRTGLSVVTGRAATPYAIGRLPRADGEAPAGVSSLYRYDGTRWSPLALPSGGTIRAVGGPSPDESYVLIDRVYRVDGMTLSALPLPSCGAAPVTAHLGMVTAPGQLVVRARCADSDRLWRWSAGAWVPLGAVPVSNVAVSEGGEIRGADLDQIYVYQAGAWTALPTETPAPPSTAVVGASPTDLYAFGAGGVAHLSGNRWVAVPSAPAAEFTSAWRAPDGVIFAVASTPVASAGVWRFSGAAWTRIYAGGLSSNVIGRSSSEVYVARGYDATQQVMRWNGTAWTSRGGPCTGWGRLEGSVQVGSVALAGAGITLARCSSNRPALDGIAYESDGEGAWTRAVESGPFASVTLLAPLDPPTSPSAFLTVGTTQRIRSGAGWLPWAPLLMGEAIPSAGPIAGSTVGALVARIPSDRPPFFGRTDGSTWRVMNDRLGARAAIGANGWTDGRYVVTAARFGNLGRTYLSPQDETGHTSALIRCDLGP